MSGDDAVDFTELVHLTGRRMHRTAYLLTGDPHAAEDLVQAAYATAFRKWRLVSRADDPAAYTLRILTRQFLSERRLRRSTEVVTDRVAEVEDSAGEPTDRLLLLDALARLAPRDRAVLVLRHWEDRSVAETAALLGISEVACRTRTTRALARLRAEMPDLEDLS
ncbi:SigE family RNA polymerase sigma factor [Nocardioides sp. J2M5]|nr:SigE family RNA polymerase sigma factor [Nocardioides palaemonis]